MENNNLVYLKHLKKKMILGAIDILIIGWLSEKPLSAQELMAKIKKEYSITLSSGTIYPILSSLCEKKIITSLQDEKRKIYSLTLKGKELSKKLFSFYTKIRRDMKTFSYNGNGSSNVLDEYLSVFSVTCVPVS